MKTTPVDPADKDTLRLWHRTALARHRHDRPDAPFWTEQEALAVVRPDDPEERLLPFLVHDDGGEVVGEGIAFVPLLDNLDKVFGILGVLPEHRGRGAGAAAVEHLLGIGRNEGRRLLIVEGYFPVDADDTHPVRAFALRHGFRLANTEIRRTLQLPIADERLRAWADDAAAHSKGYEIQTYLDTVPDALVPSLVDLMNQLAVDAPTGDLDFEAGAMSPEIYREQVARRVRSGRRILETVAVKDGVTVAQSTLSAPPGDEELPHMNQWGTYVDRDHRGHRLGLATKVANLRAVQERFPERTLLHTTNSPANGPMVAINEMLGFRPVEVMGEFLREI